MIRPSRYTNLSLSVLSIGSEIVKILKYEETIKYDTLLIKLTTSKGEKVKHAFPAALNFLFLLNKIKYYPEKDLISII